MADAWYYARNEQRFGPLPRAELGKLALEGQLLPNDLVWTEGMPDWQRAYSVAGLFSHPPGTPPAVPFGEIYPDTSRRVAAGICGILLGSLGIHKFILGLNGPGVIMLLVTLFSSCVTVGIGPAVIHVIGIIEGVIYLLKSDREFYQTYIVGRRGWF